MNFIVAQRHFGGKEQVWGSFLVGKWYRGYPLPPPSLGLLAVIHLNVAAS